MIDKAIQIKQIYDIEIITHLMATDGQEVDMKGLAKKLNQKLINKDAHCMAIFNGDIPFGFIYGVTFYNHKGFMVQELQVDDTLPKGKRALYEYQLIKSSYEILIGTKCEYFRIFPDKDMVDRVSHYLTTDDYNIQLRYSMEYIFDEKLFKPSLNDRFQFSYNLKEVYDKSNDIIRDAYKDSIDSIIFPEIFHSEELKEVDDIEEEISPLIIKDGNPIATSLVSSKSDDAALIETISVLNSYQNQGLGKRLIEEILYCCQKSGFKKVELSVTDSNRSGVALYKKVGFKIRREFYIAAKSYD